jgi:hypothetical protein
VAWYRCIYAPLTGGAHESHRRTAGIVGRLGGGAGAWPLSEAEPNINLLDLVSIPAAADWDASFTVKCINL